MIPFLCNFGLNTSRRFSLTLSNYECSVEGSLLFTSRVWCFFWHTFVHFLRQGSPGWPGTPNPPPSSSRVQGHHAWLWGLYFPKSVIIISQGPPRRVPVLHVQCCGQWPWSPADPGVCLAGWRPCCCVYHTWRRQQWPAHTNLRFTSITCLFNVFLALGNEPRRDAPLSCTSSLFSFFLI